MQEHSLTLPLDFRAAEKVGHCLPAARVGVGEADANNVGRQLEHAHEALGLKSEWL